MFLRKNKWRILALVLAVTALAVAYLYGGGAAGLRASKSESSDISADASVKPPSDLQQDIVSSDPGSESAGVTGDVEDTSKSAIGHDDGESFKSDEEYSAEQGMDIDPSTGKDKYLTDPVPEGEPVPVEPQDVEIGASLYSCTLSISCATINDNVSLLNPEKLELVPEDGWILSATAVTFNEGESVFDVLLRTCKENGIHLEFENTPIYNSAYIEGINNLYEFDCGDLSGWKYKVNDWFPNYGCSRYKLKDGDVVCWMYTCDLGADIGAGFSGVP